MATKAGLSTPAQRAKLVERREPYWKRVAAGKHVGYRAGARGGSWIARWRDETGTRAYRALEVPDPDGEKALDAATELARAWFGNAGPVAPARMDVAAACDRYAEALGKRKGEAAKRDAEGRIERAVRGAPIGRMALDRVRTADVESWHHGLVPDDLDDEGTRKAKDSANRTLTTLKAALNHAWAGGLVPTRDQWSRVKPFKDVAVPRRVFLNQDQRRRLLDASTGAFRSLLLSGMHTGARYGELRELRAEDFDRARRSLHIRRGKTGSRTVPLSDAATAFFAEQVRGKLPAAFLLMRDDGMPWQHSDQDELMREAVRKARLPAGTVFYTLRHSFISTALSNGIEITAVAKMCGTSVRIIERTYAKFLPSVVRDQLNRIAML